MLEASHYSEISYQWAGEGTRCPGKLMYYPREAAAAPPSCPAAQEGWPGAARPPVVKDKLEISIFMKFSRFLNITKKFLNTKKL